VRADRVPLEQLVARVEGLAIGTPDEKLAELGGLRLAGVNRSINFDWRPPSRPRPHDLTIPPWVKRIAAVLAEEGIQPTLATTDASSKVKDGMCSDQWDALTTRKVSQGAIMLFDHEIGRPKGHSPLAAIVLKGFPPDVGVNSNYTELVTQAACHQLAYAIDSIRKIETDCRVCSNMRKKK
jgi:hypothetical protein